MNDKELLERIVINLKIKTGKPVIKGTRLTADFILNLFAHGSTIDKIPDEYKDLANEDLQACFLYAEKFISGSEFMPLNQEV